MLEIKDLHASINGKEILKGIDLTIRDGEVHALMGQNGAGKSTLSNVLVGHPAYEVTRGTITFNGKDLLAMSPEDRAHEGIFLSFSDTGGDTGRLYGELYACCCQRTAQVSPFASTLCQ